MKKKSVVVLGGGFSGLWLGTQLLVRGYDVDVLEKEKEVGGLLQSVQIEDFNLDLGPHIYFPSHKHYYEEFLQDPLRQILAFYGFGFRNRQIRSPITLQNYAGTCGYDPPQWVEEALENRHADPRRNRSAQSFMHFSDAERKKYIHLVDGGISDNLALRPAIDFVTAVGGIEKARQIAGIEMPDHLVVIAVNAEKDPTRRSTSPPRPPPSRA